MRIYFLYLNKFVKFNYFNTTQCGNLNILKKNVLYHTNTGFISYGSLISSILRL